MVRSCLYVLRRGFVSTFVYINISFPRMFMRKCFVVLCALEHANILSSLSPCGDSALLNYFFVSVRTCIPIYSMYSSDKMLRDQLIMILIFIELFIRYLYALNITLNNNI